MIKFNANRKEFEIITKIAKRAEPFYRDIDLKDDLQSIMMDIEATHCNGTKLDLKMFLGFNDENFMHDIFGIRRHIDRETGKITDMFLPRCARHLKENRG